MTKSKLYKMNMVSKEMNKLNKSTIIWGVFSRELGIFEMYIHQLWEFY